MDNTAFGNDVPALPQWNGPPRGLVQVQAILFASLATSLLAAFLAVLGKQWLTRYDSSDVRGSAIERSHNRQRKLDGIRAWYFNYVMESLPMMLQAALLLLGFALSRYLWDISIPVASVVLGVTSFGALFYVFIVITGVVSESCPYQTPVSLALRYLGGPINLITQAIGNLLLYSALTVGIVCSVGCCNPSFCGYYLSNLGESILSYTLGIFRLGWAVVWGLATLPARAYHLVCRAGVPPEQMETASGLRCISWTLQTSLDRDIRLLTFEYLAKKAELSHFDPTLVAGTCFDILVSCINISGLDLSTTRDKEQLATASAWCFLRSVHHLSVTDPASSALADIRRRYDEVIPIFPDFTRLPFSHTMIKIHFLVKEREGRRDILWENYKPPGQVHISFARQMVEAARVEYQESQYQKVPRWILRFAIHSLSMDPPPPVPVVADCLAIAAIDLGCQVSDERDLEERCVYIEQAFAFLTETQVHEWSKSRA